MKPTAFEDAEAVLARAAARASPTCWSPTSACRARAGSTCSTRSARAGRRLPVIVMTAHSDLDSAVAAYQGGAFEYLPKPFDIDQAVELVRRAATQQQRADTTRPPIAPHPGDARPRAGHAGGVPRHRPAVALEHDRADHRRVRHRQGTRRARAAPAQPARRQAVHRAEHLGVHRRPARVRAVRPREGRVHRRRPNCAAAASSRRTAARCSSTRSATCRRSCRRACCACWPKASSTGSAGSCRSRSTCASSPRRTRTSRRASREGLFREDLLHRLNVIRIDVPPLRQRREDIPELLQHYLDVAALELGVAPKVLGRRRSAALVGVRLARQRAPARQRLPPADGAGGGPRDHARRHPRRSRRRPAPQRQRRRTRLVQCARELGPGAARRRRHAAARRCDAGVRAHADPRSAEGRRAAAARTRRSCSAGAAIP